MLKRERGFTIFELLVVVSIIALISGIVSVNYRLGGRQSALQRASEKLSQDMRSAQEMAMSLKESPGGNVPDGGYGVYFAQYGVAPNINYNIYLYADNNGNERYDSGEEVETIYRESNGIYLEKGIKIKSIVMTRAGANTVDPAAMNINFMPPEPDVRIRQTTPGVGPNQDSAAIILALTVDPNVTRTVFANKVGLINVR